MMDSGYLFQLPWALFGAEHHPKRHLWTKAAAYQVCLSCLDQHKWRRETMWTKDKKEGWRQHKAANRAVISHFLLPYFLFIFCGLLSQGNRVFYELGDAICQSEFDRVYSNIWTYILLLYMYVNTQWYYEGIKINMFICTCLFKNQRKDRVGIDTYTHISQF